MNASPSTLRRIRSALRLAADLRAPNGESRSAARMAAKLMRKHGVTDADLWADPHEVQPGAAKLRVSVVLNTEDDRDRAMFAIRIVASRYPDVQSFLWTSRINVTSAYIEFVGPHVEEASEFWKYLNRELWETWAVMQKLKGFSLLTPGSPMPYNHFSWLAGMADGFESQDIIDTKPEPPPSLPKPKKRRRNLPRKNKFALGPIFIAWKPALDKMGFVYENSPMSVAAWCEANMQLPPFPSPPPSPPSEPRMIHGQSYGSGLIFGRRLARRFPRKDNTNV